MEEYKIARPIQYMFTYAHKNHNDKTVTHNIKDILNFNSLLII